MKFFNQTILVTSNEPWGGLWFSKQHYANELSRENKVYFVNAPGKWNLHQLFKKKLEKKQISPSLMVLELNNYFPLTGRFNLLFRLNEWLTNKMLSKFFRQEKVSNLIVFAFNPFHLLQPKQIKQVTLAIYYSVDHYPSIEREAMLCKNVDIIFIISHAYKKKYEKYKKPLYYLSHGIPDHGYSEEELLQPNLKDEALIMGSFTKHIDYQLLYELAKKFEEIKFRLIGLIQNLEDFSLKDLEYLDKLKKMKNVFFEKNKPYSDLYSDMLGAKICMVCYKGEGSETLRSPLKALQYLSFGKTVVCGNFQTFEDVPEIYDLLYVCNNNEEFIERFRKLLTEKELPEIIKKRIRFAQQFTYFKIFRKIEKFIDEARDLQRQ